MRIWRIDVACWVILLGLGGGFMVIGFLLYKGNPGQLVFFIFISYVLWILAFLISNLSLIEASIEYLPNWATRLLAWMGMPKAIAQQVYALKEALKRKNKRRTEKIMKLLNTVVSRGKKGLESSNWRIQKEAVEILGLVVAESFGVIWNVKTEIINLLVGMLKDPTADVRSSARLALVKIGPEAMVALKRALRERDPELSEEVDMCLKQMKRMANDGLKAEDWRERVKAVNALGKMINPAQKSEINNLGLTLNDNHKEVRLAVLEALISIASSDVIPFLKQALEDREEEIREKAMNALDKIRQGLLAKLENEDLRVRVDAVRSLGLIGNEKDIEKLKSRLLDESISVREEAVKAVSSIGGEKVIDVLMKALNDKAEWVSKQAAEALSEIGESAIEPLGEKLLNGTNLERLLAAETLGMMKIAQAAVPLREAEKKETDRKVRQAIISALTKLENAIPFLMKENTELPLSEKLKNYFQLQDSIKSEYREITFVDIDVAGSTNLKAGEPKEAVVYSFGQYNQILDNLAQKHRGEEFNCIGDERILMFINPTDAVKMGVELQNTLIGFNKDKTKNRLSKPFKTRIGINTGDCLIDPMLENSDVADHTLDVACHLQKYGEPGTVYISENTYSNLELKTENQFEGPVKFQEDNIRIYIYR